MEGVSGGFTILLLRRVLLLSLFCLFLEPDLAACEPELMGRVEEFTAELATSSPSEKQEEGLWNASMLLMPQEQLTNLGTVGFATYKAYRLSGTRIAVIGLGLISGLLVEAESTWSCAWVDHNSGARIPGNLTYATTHEAKAQYPYEGAMLLCDLEEAACGEKQKKTGTEASSPAPSSGLKDEGEAGCESAAAAEGEHRQREGGHAGGHLEVRVKDVDLVAYVEREQPLMQRSSSQGPFQHEVVFCGPPVHSRVQPRSISQWADYHLYYAGYGHIYWYDVGAEGGAEMRQEVKRFVEAGVMTIVPWAGQRAYRTWYYAQNLAIQDCLFRNMHNSAWVAFGDFDEYLQLMFTPPTTLRQFLRVQLQTQPHIAWFSHGSAEFQHKCLATAMLPAGAGAQALLDPRNASGLSQSNSFRELQDHGLWDPAEDRFAVEFIPFRDPEPRCSEHWKRDPGRCPFSWGHRKVIVNPRRVTAVQIHQVAIPNDGSVDDTGVNLHTVLEMRHAHFSGLTGAAKIWCTGNATELDASVYDSGIMQIASRARECADRRSIPTYQCA